MSDASTPAPVLGEIMQICISVDDLDRAVAFYRDVLGLPFLFQVPGMPMAFFQNGPVRLYLDASDGPVTSHPILYFRVVDIHAAFVELRDRGVEFVSEPHLVTRTETNELWLCELHDTEGNTMALASEVPVTA